jgi:hypothetical protein
MLGASDIGEVRSEDRRNTLQRSVGPVIIDANGIERGSSLGATDGR